MYRQFIQLIRNGLNALDENSVAQIREFVESQQHKNGGFVNRSGRADFYYSVFGFWLSSALNLKPVLEAHEAFINSQELKQQNSTINRLSILLIKAGFINPGEKPSVFSLLKTVLNGRQINSSYRFFLFFLIIDAQNRRKKILYLVAKIALLFVRTPKNVPCSILAAFTFAKKEVGLSFKKEQKRLLSFHVENSGFKSFEHVKNADMLSTAVALFTLKNTNSDLRLIAPGCFEFIENNFYSGAFLSGDGDSTRDLEYTFYGLLALGTLVENG